MERYEDILFTQCTDTVGEFFAILDEHGPDAALDFATEWHFPGEHDTRPEPSHGRSDTVHKRDGYILSWCRGFDYFGLQYDTEYETRTVGYFIEPEELAKLRAVSSTLHAGSDRERDAGHKVWLVVNAIEACPVTQSELDRLDK